MKGYVEILKKFESLGTEWVQFDEPALVQDLTVEDLNLFNTLYRNILKEKRSTKILLQTYFGDLRDYYQEITALDFDGFGLDFLEGKETLH